MARNLTFSVESLATIFIILLGVIITSISASTFLDRIVRKDNGNYNLLSNIKIQYFSYTFTQLSLNLGKGQLGHASPPTGQFFL